MNNKFAFFISALLIFILGFCSLNLYYSSMFDVKQEAKVIDSRKFAGVLVSQKLYKDAAELLKKHLAENLIAPSERESTLLYLADIYLENLMEYENAMAVYLRLLYEYPETKFKIDAERKILECKEKLGRRFEAMTEMAALEDKNKKGLQSGARAGTTAENSITVAKIGDEIITMTDFAREVDVLYEGMAANFAKDRDSRIKLLKEVVAQKVLKRTAASKRFDSDPEILKKTDKFKTQLMLQKLLNDDVVTKVTVDDLAVSLYYEGHKNEMRTPDLYKFDYVSLNDETAANELISDGGSGKFAAHSPKVTGLYDIQKLSAELNCDFSEGTAEISTAKHGDIVKKIFKKMDGGYLVLKIAEIQKGQQLPLESVKEKIRQSLLSQKTEAEIQSYVIKKLAEMKVTFYEEAFSNASTDEAKLKK